VEVMTSNYGRRKEPRELRNMILNNEKIRWWARDTMRSRQLGVNEAKMAEAKEVT